MSDAPKAPPAPLARALPADLYQPGEHELALLEALTHIDCSDSRFVVEQPVTIMLFTNRSGSSLLGEYLRATGCFSGFGEPLSHQLVIARAKEHKLYTLEDYLRWLMDNVARPGTQFGLKLSLDQVVLLLRSGAIPRIFKNVNWLHIYRRDLVAQAVSFSVAAQTESWQSFEASNGREPDFDPDQIILFLHELSMRYEKTRRLLNLHGLPYQDVAYEDFITAPEVHTLEIARALGAPAETVDPQRLKMRKQGSGLNKAYRERFVREYLAQIDLHEVIAPSTDDDRADQGA